MSEAIREGARFFRYRAFWAILLGMTGSVYLQFLFLTWIPTYLSSLLKTNVLIVGFMSAAIFGFGVLGNVASGVAGDALLRQGWSVSLTRNSIIVMGMLLCSPITVPGSPLGEAPSLFCRWRISG
ncbi:MAG: hypothetical protein JOZ05_16820 [Acetobacteraceae bacterium]|nr:hypothetical protein [Acetobacteraceae bacterium]